MNLRKYFIYLLIFQLLIFSKYPCWAQDAEGDTLTQERAFDSLAEEEEIQPVEIISEDRTIIGTVKEIVITGELVTSRAAVLRQLVFRIGDQISKYDIALSRKYILGLNSIYWKADITYELLDDESNLRIIIDLAARRTWFIMPSYPAGGAIGDRNFLGSADMVTLGIFIDNQSGDSLYTFSYTDPQFLGTRNSMSLETHILDATYSIRTDSICSTGESYYISRNGFSLNYRTRIKKNLSLGLGYNWDQVIANKKSDPAFKLGTEDYFYLSQAEIPDGYTGAFTIQLSGGTINSRFFPTKGYYWDLYSEISNDLTLSDFEFTRHTLTAATFKDIHENRNVLCGRIMYSYLTGDPPNYELIPFDWQVRGYVGTTHRGKSALAMNFEYRFIAEPDIFQVVVFADFGRSWDDHELSLGGLEFGYGAGIRIYTAPFIPYNLLLRIDYAYSNTGEEAIFGFNQFF